MTLLVQKPSGAKLLMRQTWAPADTDAAAYIAAVEAADGQALEERTRKAIDDFVMGCKADGIWSAIKASCILAGARTLTGALVPLAGAAPTNVGPFVAGDYNRKTGLVGDGSTKYLNSNRNNNADPQNSKHLSAYVTQASSSGSVRVLIGVPNGSGPSSFWFAGSSGAFEGQLNAASVWTRPSLVSTVGLFGQTRSTSGSLTSRAASSNSAHSIGSEGPMNASLQVFAANNLFHFNGRLAFYSIGESLDLALLDARVTQLITTFAAVIP
jgi:hypothetical protein